MKWVLVTPVERELRATGPLPLTVLSTMEATATLVVASTVALMTSLPVCGHPLMSTETISPAVALDLVTVIPFATEYDPVVALELPVTVKAETPSELVLAAQN